jgi:putative tricarboxylic transport membrane protein
MRVLTARRGGVGLAVMVLGAVWLHGATSIASTTFFIGLGPAALIYGLGAGMLLLGTLLLVQQLRTSPARLRDETTAADAHFSRQGFWLALAGVAVPLVSMKPLGFPITAVLAFVLVTHAFGSRRTLFDLGVGTVLAIAVWWAFSRLGIALGPFLPILN